VLIVSADPAADTPARVSGFLAETSLADRVHYLSGPPTRLPSVWRAYRIAPASAGRAAFARSASVLLLDARGRERVLFGLEQLTPETLAHDIRRLQAG
jgi:cytochrome oxidase Cu insertion factor (SCO1/SenC/PrrC family)